MADIKDTLHPEGHLEDNLYPNIKADNVPNNSLGKIKLDSEVNSLLKLVGANTPSGAASSSIILAKTSDQGLWVGTDTGKWYYWNGSKYVAGGTWSQNTDPLVANEIDNKYGDTIVASSNSSVQIGDNTLDIGMVAAYDFQLDVGDNSALKVSYDYDTNITTTKITHGPLQVDEIDNSNGNAMLRYKSTENKVVVGTSEKPLTLMGSGDRPTYSKNGSDFSGEEITIKTDIKNITINNPCINLASNVISYTNGKYIDNNGNENSTVPFLSYIKKVKVTNYNRICLYFYNGGIQQPILGCFFDKDDNFISSMSSNKLYTDNNGAFIIKIPSNAEYFKLNSLKDTLSLLKQGNYCYLFYSKDEETTNYNYLYNDSLNKPFDFKGKKILAFGDSITAGVISPTYGVTQNSYIKLFANKVNATLVNKAVSGATIVNEATRSESIYTTITSTSEAADIIIISGGTNDYNLNKNLGTFDTEDTTTFYGAMRMICQYISDTWSNATVIFITPINVSKDISGYKKDRLNLYRNAIYEIATVFGYNVVNGIDLVPVNNQGNWNNYMIADADGVHPTEAGHKLYFRNLCNKLL